MGDQSKDDLRQNPFKKLKGFCASSPKKVSRGQELTPERRDDSPEEDDATLFAREMNRLGLDAAAPKGSEEEPPQKVLPQAKGKAAAPVTDLDAFLAALGEMDTTFADEFPIEEDEPRAEPRRMRQLRQGKLLPESNLDLHGLSRAEALQRVRFFLENARHHGFRTVLVVTGRGKSSGGEPVVRKEVERYLDGEGRSLVSEWGRAPRQFGGEGALVIFLKTIR